jgi:TPR repeat protein
MDDASRADYPRAGRAYDLACKGGDQPGCTKLATLAGKLCAATPPQATCVAAIVALATDGQGMRDAAPLALAACSTAESGCVVLESTFAAHCTSGDVAACEGFERLARVRCARDGAAACAQAVVPLDTACARHPDFGCGAVGRIATDFCSANDPAACRALAAALSETCRAGGAGFGVCAAATVVGRAATVRACSDAAGCGAACSAGDPDACTALGNALLSGKYDDDHGLALSVAKDEPRGRAVLEKLCAATSGKLGCYDLAQFYGRCLDGCCDGDDARARADPSAQALAAGWVARACTGGEEDACTDIARAIALQRAPPPYVLTMDRLCRAKSPLCKTKSPDDAKCDGGPSPDGE